MGKFRFLAGAALGVSMLLIPSANASVMFNTSFVNPGTGNTVSGLVTFSIIGFNLTITLQNISPAPIGKYKNGDVLQAVSFSLPGATLTRVSATSTVSLYNQVSGATTPGIVVVGGGEYAYRAGFNGLDAVSHVGYHGVSGAGYSYFGAGNRFVGANLEGPLSPNGGQYGIVSPLTALATESFSGANNTTFVKDRVAFVLSLSGTFLESAITDVRFNFGTDLGTSGPGCPGQEVGACDVNVPEPGSMPLLLIGLLGLGGLAFAGARRARA